MISLPDSINLDELKLLEVYEEYDGPRLFSCMNADGQLFLSLWVDDESDKDIWLYLPISKQRLKDIKSNKIDLREAFLNAEGGHEYLVITPFFKGEAYSKKVTCRSLDDKLLPESGEYLERRALTKAELIAQVAGEAQVRKVDAEKIINALMKIVTNALKKDGRLALAGFGSFALAQRKARKGRNPKTGESIKIPATRVVKFKPGKTLKVVGE
jgi:DNA-binding protein HU-beta